jgi:superfamily II DNA or RNA helicase
MFELRQYQLKTIQSLRLKMSQGLKRLIMLCGTGGGKTIMFCFMISKALEKNRRCLILTHRTELLTQAGGTLEKFGLNPSVVNPKVKNLPTDNNLFVAMTKTIMARINKSNTSQHYIEWLQSFDLIIIDEAHLQDFNSLLPYLNPNSFVIGATATAERKGNQTCLSKFYQYIVNEITISELIELGFLANPHSFGVTIDLSNIKTKGGDYDNDMVGDLFEKTQLYEGVYENYQRLTPNKKAIIFAPNIKSSLLLVEKLSDKGLPIKHIDGNTQDKEREHILKWFKETPNALISNVGILTAGFDEPNIEVVILYRATKSLPLFLQMIGRGSRTTEVKKDFYILDFGNNITRHGFWEQDREWSLIKKPKTKGIAPVKDCKCGALLRLNLQICPYCGFKFPPQKVKETIEVVLEKLKKEDIDLYKQYQKFIKLEKKALDKGFKKGWLLYQLKTTKDFYDYEKYKNYKYGWAKYQIEQRGIIDTITNSGVFS